MYAQDPERYLQFYREDDADAQLEARPAPLEALGEAIARLSSRIGQRVRAWLDTPQERLATEDERLALR